MERIEQKENDVVRVTIGKFTWQKGLVMILQGGKFNKNEIAIEKQSIPAMIEVLKKYIEPCQP